VAADWRELGEVRPADAERGGFDRVLARFEKAYDVTGVRALVGAGQVWRFVSEVRPGDLVLVPNEREGLVHLGRVTGDCEWVERPSDGCPFPRRRAVAWLRDLAAHDLPLTASHFLSTPATIASVESELEAVDRLAAGEPAPGGAGRAALLRGIVASLGGASEEQLAAFVRALLAALGCDVEAWSADARGVWRATGTLSAGLVDVFFRFRVHASLADVSASAVTRAREDLLADEEGAVLTLGRFAEAARVEALAEGKKPVRLVDGEALAALALAQWERLPASVRARLGVRRTEHTTVEVRFQPSPRT
jgi:restriction system protein